MVGRLVELFTDGVPTTCMSLYLMPHANVVMEALHIARTLGKPVEVTTIAEAVGSDITNIVRTCVEEGRFGAAAQVFATYLAHDRCVAVSEYTKELIIESAEAVDSGFGTAFADQCRDRVTISYPAVNSRTFTEIEDAEIEEALAARGLERDGYVLFLSRLTPAKGVDDLIEGFVRSCVASTRRLVIAGTGWSAM
jgi:glycosyltransferase involved in cell wall biosynthesis